MSNNKSSLSALYKLQATDQPNDQLNENILQLAKDQLVKNKKTQHRFNYAPYSVAASLMFVGVLVFYYPNYYQPTSTFDSEYSPSNISQQMPIKPLATAMPQQKTASEPQLLETISEESSPKSLFRAAPTMEKNKQITLLVFNEKQQLAIDEVNKLLADNNNSQAILKLKEIQKQWPTLILPVRHQQLLTADKP